ncbi:hypothetical protein FACS189413_01760 [Bacteroidia bacterium]|nr:hypothetical protein FACS189413_01760 [Bacteroidia bacterium]
MYIMKKIVLLLILAVSCLQLNAETAVFLKNGGTGNGSTPATPTGSLNTAYKAIEDSGGEGAIVIVDKFTLVSAFARNIPKNENITITSKYDGVDYRDGNPNCILDISKGLRWTLFRPTTFENITFSDAGVSTPYILFIANFHPITMGEGIEVQGFPSTEIATSLAILGGSQSGQTGAPATNDADPYITIKSGKFIVVGFSRQVDVVYTGTAHINISGGEIATLYGGSLNNGKGGSIDLNISGGTFISSIYACESNSSRATYASGNASIVISGGDFTYCGAIFANMDGESIVDLSGLADVDYVKRRLYYAGKLITAGGEVPFLTPNKVFDYGNYTDSKGQMIPYRIYYPENYDESKKYPLVLYMHGNGSRGSDNETHLLTGGSAFTSTLINSGQECIILAPQAPLSSSWVTTYPGNAGYTVASVPMGSYLNAAKELFDSILTKPYIDKSRIYVFGVSNGGGATWDLMCRFPDLFAAGIPMCGNGESSNAAAIGSLLTEIPIWAFHGDADETLSVEGTRGIVAAIEAAGGTKIEYTEYPGVGHEAYFFSAHEGLIEWFFAQKKTPTSIENIVSQDDQVVATEYFNLQGVQIPVGALRATPLPTGVYLVKQTLKSGQTKVSKQLIINKI